MKDHETVQYVISDSEHVREHTGENLIQCDQCNVICDTTDNLAIHIKVQGDLLLTQLSDHESQLTAIPTIVFACTECDHKCLFKQELVNHIAATLNISNSACEISRSKNLKL